MHNHGRVPDKPINRTHLSLYSPGILVKPEVGGDREEGSKGERSGEEEEEEIFIGDKPTRLPRTTTETRVNDNRCRVMWNRWKRSSWRSQGQASS